MSKGELVQEWARRARAAGRAAHEILAKHEGATKSRVVILEDLLDRLGELPVDIADYFKEATTCLANGQNRAAVVLSWSGFFYVLAESCFVQNEAQIRLARPKWTFTDFHEFKAKHSEYHVLEALRAAKCFKNQSFLMYAGQLATRNQCAHPTLYRPSMNSALGYVDDMLRQTLDVIGP